MSLRKSFSINKAQKKNQLILKRDIFGKIKKNANYILNFEHFAKNNTNFFFKNTLFFKAFFFKFSLIHFLIENR